MSTAPPTPPAARLVLLALMLLPPGAALAQGQDSVTAPMGPQTSAHPPPLLSTASVTSVPSGKPLGPVPGTEPPKITQANALDLPGMVTLAPPSRLVCGEIAVEAFEVRRGQADGHGPSETTVRQEPATAGVEEGRAGCRIEPGLRKMQPLVPLAVPPEG